MPEKAHGNDSPLELAERRHVETFEDAYLFAMTKACQSLGSQKAFFEKHRTPPTIAQILADDVRLKWPRCTHNQIVARVGKDFAALKSERIAEAKAAKANESHGFEKQFKADPNVPHKEKGYLQRVFQVPSRPDYVTTLPDLISWLEQRIASWPLLSLASGNHNVAVPALSQATLACGGDTVHLYRLVERAERSIKDLIVQSALWNSLMCEDHALWRPDMLNAIFKVDSPSLPEPILPSDVYGKSLWVREYSRRAFISVDIREANFSVLRIMASLVDPALNMKLGNNWGAMLDDILSPQEKQAVGSCKQFRQKVLGGMHSEWIDRQKPHLSKEAFRELESKRRFFGQHDAGFNKISKEIQHTIMRQVAARVGTTAQLPVFAFLGDEVIFNLPENTSAADADRTAKMVQEILPHIFKDHLSNLKDILRVDANLVLDLSPYYQDTDHGSYALLCRRTTASNVPELSLQLKGIRGSNRFLESTELKKLGDGVCCLQRENLAEWSSWLGELTSRTEEIL